MCVWTGNGDILLCSHILKLFLPPFGWLLLAAVDVTDEQSKEGGGHQLQDCGRISSHLCTCAAGERSSVFVKVCT